MVSNGESDVLTDPGGYRGGEYHSVGGDSSEGFRFSGPPPQHLPAWLMISSMCTISVLALIGKHQL